MWKEDSEKVAENEELIAAISIPAGSKIPNPSSDLSTPTEYDMYFRIIRSNGGLIEWSRACLDIFDRQVRDLENTSLTLEEKSFILQGILTIHKITLEKWVKAGEILQQEGHDVHDKG
jgi:excinuclease UvrABC ATPase subunit